jgi:broad specificity phosphatase PhoE
MATTIYIIRHGEKQKIKGDPPLTAKGQAQVKKTAQHLSNKNVHVVLSSPILRSKQTAEIISKELNLTFKVDDLLRERANWGDDQNQSFEQFLEMWNRSTVDRDWIPPVGDSSRDAGNRIHKIISSSDYSDLNLVLVTHGGIIGDFLRNIFDEKLLKSVVPSLTDSLEDTINEASITTVYFDPISKEYKLININFIDHLNGF